MRRTRQDAKHDPPYLEDLIVQADRHVQALRPFNMRLLASFTQGSQVALEQLWSIFQNLSYHGRSRHGLAGVVGVSKAVLLLTEGRIGPAFDSQVRNQIGIRAPKDAREWIQALQLVSQDIQAFEETNRCKLQEAAPGVFAAMRSGRIYDMALGPGRRER